jgi:hypothetical protein
MVKSMPELLPGRNIIGSNRRGFFREPRAAIEAHTLETRECGMLKVGPRPLPPHSDRRACIFGGSESGQERN